MQRPLSYIELSKQALLKNVKALSSIVPTKKIACVVKANAYGHGAREVIGMLTPHADYFQVDDIEELRFLRTRTRKPAFVFGYVQMSELEEAVRLGGILALYDLPRMRALEQIGRKRKKTISVHVKIDAFLGRQGVLLEALPSFIRELKKMTHIRVAGVYSHFANIEDTTNMAHARMQAAALGEAIALFKKSGFTNFETHISATSGVLSVDTKLPTTLVRLGVGIYGMWPSPELEKAWHKKLTLTPVMRWVSHIAQVKEIPKGFSVGYGCTYIAKRPTTIAVIPQGYSDGFDRGLSNCGEVLIHGKRAPIIGRVAMNIIVADVTHIKNVRAEDEVVLLGAQGKARITAEEIAEKIGTINYEITTRVSPLLSRIVK